jgi:hypothetical protein
VLLPAALRINSGAAQSFQDADNNTWAADFGNIGVRSLCMLCLLSTLCPLRMPCTLCMPLAP